MWLNMRNRVPWKHEFIWTSTPPKLSPPNEKRYGVYEIWSIPRLKYTIYDVYEIWVYEIGFTVIGRYTELKVYEMSRHQSGHTDHEAKSRRCRQFPHDKAVALAGCRQPGGCWRIPYIGSRGKTPWGKPVSAINTVRKSQARRAEARGNSAPLPHMAHSNLILVFKHEFPGQWVGYSCAVPGWANEPGRTQLLLLHLQIFT